MRKQRVHDAGLAVFGTCWQPHLPTAHSCCTTARLPCPSLPTVTVKGNPCMPAAFSRATACTPTASQPKTAPHTKACWGLLDRGVWACHPCLHASALVAHAALCSTHGPTFVCWAPSLLLPLHPWQQPTPDPFPPVKAVLRTAPAMASLLCSSIALQLCSMPAVTAADTPRLTAVTGWETGFLSLNCL